TSTLHRPHPYFSPPALPPPASPLFPYTTLFRSRGFKVMASRPAFGLGLSVLTPTTEITPVTSGSRPIAATTLSCRRRISPKETRSEEHTSELQSRGHLVCRLLLEKKKKKENQKT